MPWSKKREHKIMENFLWPFFFSVFALLFLSLRKFRQSHFSAEHPPGPTPLPLLGNLLQLGSNPHRSLAQLAQKYGPVMALKLGSVYTIVVSSSSTARVVLQTNDQCLCGRYAPDVVKDQGLHEDSSAWMPPKQSWKILRTLMKTHIFSPRILNNGQSLRRRKVQQLITFIRGHSGEEVYIGKAAFCTMLNMISTSFFSMDIVDVNSDAAQEFKDLIRGLMEEAGAPNISDFFSLLAPLDLQGRRRRFTACYDKLNAILEQIIRNRLEEEGTVISHDILDVLLKQKEEDGTKLSVRTIKSLFIDSFVAGGDTSAATVEWAMVELLRRPELMKKTRSEIEDVIGLEREVEESDFARLPFFNAVLKETLRLHPPLPLLLPHRAEETTEISGYKVPQGSQVVINVWAIGRDEQVWEKPDYFMPERFLDETVARSEVDFHGQHFELLPFSSGRRMCPGLPLAARMVQLMLASLIQSFKWKLPEGMEPADLDLHEKFGVSLVLASPLKVLAIE